jgi:hypothetical protein
MSVWHIIGIDPGLVHTGVVRVVIDYEEVTVSHALIKGMDVTTTAWWIRAHRYPPDRIYIEKYDPHLNYKPDESMLKGEAGFKRELKKAVLLRNTGVKKLVTNQVLHQLDLWNFNTPSHHQDLRSAARIAVLGMMKDDELNKVLADLIKDALDGCAWTITNLGGEVVDANDAVPTS